MTKVPVRAEPYRRTRSDHSTETAEDYVEAVAQIIGQKGICRGVNLASHFAVSHVTVNRIVERLQKDGLLVTEPYKPISLTAKGKRLAAKCVERHTVVYNFLRSIGIDAKNAALDAEGIEHHVSVVTLKRFRQLAHEAGFGVDKD